MVAKKISNGLLFLVEKNQTGAVSLSNDFSDIIKMKYLPMNWHGSIGQSEKSSFRVGICSLTPGNGIHWVESQIIGGIYSFQDLSSVLGNN
jgi:hypothetical protein